MGEGGLREVKSVVVGVVEGSGGWKEGCFGRVRKEGESVVWEGGGGGGELFDVVWSDDGLKVERGELNSMRGEKSELFRRRGELEVRGLGFEEDVVVMELGFRGFEGR